MKVQMLVEKLQNILEKDPEAVVQVTGYTTILVSGKGIEAPIKIG